MVESSTTTRYVAPQRCVEMQLIHREQLVYIRVESLEYYGVDVGEIIDLVVTIVVENDLDYEVLIPPEYVIAHTPITESYYIFAKLR